jgi:tRNA nucleotidyltransferase (CCA-adding enzyme)
LIGLAPKPSIGLELLRETGILAIVLPELVEGVGIEQNEWHAYDVYRHTLATVDATPAGDRTLRFAALFHDVGKPRTKDGPHFYRHEAVGAEMTAAILDRLRFPGDEAATVVSLVRHHMYVANPEARDGVIRRVINAVGVDRLDRQFALRAADVVGSGKPKRDDSNERFEERVRALVAERPAFSVRDLAIDGGDVIAALVAAGRLPPGSRGGKDVGALLSALFERVTDDPGLNDRPRLLALLDDLVRRST